MEEKRQKEPKMIKEVIEIRADEEIMGLIERIKSQVGEGD
jgi:hypothetical protein